MRFEDTGELKGAAFVNVDLSGSLFQNVNLTGARLREAMLVDARLSGLIDGLVVNDVEVAPLIVAELDRRYPERTKLRPRDPSGVREAWSVIEALWLATLERARSLPEPTLHQRVDGEWSFLETIRHLVFVTDAWIGGRVLGRSDHHHRFAMPPSFITEVEPFGIDLGADPTLAEVVAVREERMAVVADLVSDITDGGLLRQCGEQDVLACLLTVFDEEWHHNWFANRDLDVLVAATP
jgi:uncharacterized protein YjbI with pentapeptide repeats